MGKIVCIDAGHGGTDSGATWGEETEKEIALGFAHRLAGVLRRRGYRVQFTRDEDRSRSLPQRVATSNAAGADAFVSLHVNQNPARRAWGFQAIHMRGSERGRQLAAAIFSHMYPEGRPVGSWARVATDASEHVGYTRAAEAVVGSRPGGMTAAEALQRAGIAEPFRTLYVLRHTRAPAVLVELGFLSNVDDRVRMRAEWWLQHTAGAIADGLDEFLGGAQPAVLPDRPLDPSPVAAPAPAVRTSLPRDLGRRMAAAVSGFLSHL
jgi:N-acetylmuramoyl-L-alanine amidase